MISFRSISSRLFLLSAGWLIVALIATALLLTELYAAALDRQLRETLEFNLETLVARSLSVGGVAEADLAAADPRFERTFSGWYWSVSTATGELVNISSSLLGSTLPTVTGDFSDLGRRSATAQDDVGANIRIIERRIALPEGEFVFSVSGNLDDITTLTGQFRNQTLLVLLAVGAALAVMSALVARVALRPIARLRSEIEDVRDGVKGNIEQKYPTELEPLTEEVNALLHSNQQIVERARAQVGNLAHGLKTPLAVIRNEADASKGALAKIVNEQADRMSDMVTTYLDRARMAARTAVVGKRANASEGMERLVRVMRKLHADKTIDATIAPDVWFRGEDADFEELIGNLFDNACKFCRGQVHIGLEPAPRGRGFLRVTISDDGAGLTADEQKAVLKRGVRLDEKVQGSGLGLDIVKELVDIYGGALELDRAELGGLKVSVELPAAKSPSSSA